MSKSMKSLTQWLDDAQWWHFWNPGSGLVGGAIAGGITLVFLYLVVV